ncbi:helix-turn-helix transcriptional regulator [Streptomyces cellulosae]|uniref:Helix-turn-helix transcriptional regulator n=2 Tax=Streptomyces TaxID=1883 RepID=A0ABU3J5U1_9ACTN|nr:helix-turn-helix domain-containing protein [Streptomyces sp. McG8]MDQ0485739.1 transcriptional regulator with XRE-family HTH domain [Streptomyces thermodiastaticus]MDT6969141.1 helix-turn-helix transcriptional regulator [Streptomyces thermocarboxydus]MYQ36225.1 helix-turn-helix domain-containing protein [Streptomyces sp. SID4956]MYW56417.1 helix-turn-helix domain-containing protein [Streptomyces sp. SID8376]WSB43374.1 helix-turn-helix transcriptional regulator [Streptomyces cellulosae]
MAVNGEAVRVGPGTDQADEPGWEVDPDDDWALAVVATVGRQLKLRREAVGLRVPEFAVAVGYGEDLVYKIESGKRIPRPEYLDTADEVLRAGGLVAAMKEDVRKVRYPKKVRDLAQMEARAVELQLYDPLHIHGLLQTPEYARALLSMRRPAYSAEEVERFASARVARRAIFDRDPAPELGFILEEWTLRRPLGGREVLRTQLEHLLTVAALPTVELQVMPTDRQEHAGVDGGIEVLKFADGTAVGRSPAVAGGRPVSDLRQLRILELRCGIIRAQALTPRESITFVEDLLGET